LAAGLLPVFGLIGVARAESTPESTFDRVRRTKELRIAVLPGELPYFQKDLASGEWSGAAISMAKDIAKVFDAKLTYTESTYGNSVLDLQSNKVDLSRFRSVGQRMNCALRHRGGPPSAPASIPSVGRPVNACLESAPTD
jgi:hypothetical protein